MENNLYRAIKMLIEKQKELRRKGVYIKHDKSKRDEFEALVKEYNEIDEALDVIEKEFFISAKMLEQIISKNNKKDYKLKIFREVVTRDEDVFYSYRFLMCYLDENNPFYNFESNGRKNISWTGIPEEQYTDFTVDEETFKKIHESLKNPDSESIFLASSEESNFYPCISPSSYIEGVNFIKEITGRSFGESIVSDYFSRIIRDMIKHELEEIKIDDEKIMPAQVGASTKGE